jgi:hypothetical protein
VINTWLHVINTGLDGLFTLKLDAECAEPQRRAVAAPATLSGHLRLWPS